jgi:N-acyl-D-aspartate/D-glutamate deacylase
MIDDIIEFVDNEDEEDVINFVDQKKAFDRIELTTRFWNKHHQVRSISKDWKGK